MPRIAFWGSPTLTTEYLDALERAGMKPTVIVTNPDRPKGRGHMLTPTPAKSWGLYHGVPVLTPEALDDAFYAELAVYDLDVSIVVAYGRILKERFIELPKHKTLNVHYSLLPRFRGASPVEAAILAGDTETGCSIQVMAPSLDSGPIVAEERLSIGESETAPILKERLTHVGAALLVKTLPDYLAGTIKAEPQDPSGMSVCGKIKKEDGHIDPSGDPTTNYRKYRAYAEWPRTYFFHNEKRVIITQAHFENGMFVIDRVLPEGKKEIGYADFLKHTTS